jgi:hypothetical protein
VKNIVLIDGSPKINEKSVSKYLTDSAARFIDDSSAVKSCINVRQSFTKHTTEDDFKIFSKADAVIIAFPLYIFCMPGILMRFLQDYYQFYLENRKNSISPKIYTMVNCGFPEPEINLEAVRVISSFCRSINAHFRFGIMIGCGGMLTGAEGKPVIRKAAQKLNDALVVMSKDICSNDLNKIDNVAIRTIPFPPRIFLFIMNKFGWSGMARKNSLRRKDLYRKPY